MEKVVLQGEKGETLEFFVLEQTRVGGKNYLLTTDSEEGDGECVILKDLSEEEEKEGLYEVVEEERELDAVLPVFEQLLEDVDITR